MKNVKKMIVSFAVLIAVFILLDSLYFHLLFNKPRNYQIIRQEPGYLYDQTVQDLTVTGEAEVVGYETDKVQLLIDPTTSGVSIRNKATGETWKNTTTDVVNLIEKDYSMSVFTVEYITIDGNIQTLFSYKNAVERKAVKYKQLPNGIRVEYQISNKQKVDFTSFPKFISKKNYLEKIYDKLDYVDKARIEMIYTYNPRYDYYEIRDYYNVSVYDYERIMQIFEKVGFSQADVDAENQRHSFYPAIPPLAIFDIVIDYMIEENGDLVVVIPRDRITENPSNVLKSIKLFPYFLKATQDETGYMIVPDGSGALINLNNGKLKGGNYYQKIYTNEPVFDASAVTLTNERALMPVYGIVTEGKSILAIIESGGEIASVSAEVAGKSNVRFNRIHSIFEYRKFKTQQVIPGSSKYVKPLWNEVMYNDDIVMRYKMFDFEDNVDYTRMAKAYQEYLVERYDLKKIADQRKTFIDFLGAIEVKKYFLGIPYQASESLTTYAELEKIINELKAADVDNLSVSLKGWMNKGLQQELPKDIELARVLGSKKELQKLANTLKNDGIPFYLDVAFSEYYESKRLFNQDKLIANRSVDNEIVYLYPFNPVSLRLDHSKTPYLSLSPKYLVPTIRDFMKDFNKLGINNLAVNDIGQSLYLDYKYKDEAYYDKALDATKNAFDELSRYQLMIRGGNEYALAYSNLFVDVPLDSNNYYKVDKSIPFLQLALGGYVELYSKSVNVADYKDYDWYLLKALETGTNLKYTLSYENSSVLKNTEFNAYYSTYYLNWMERIIESAQVLKQVSSTVVVEHQEVALQVYKSVYEDGTIVYTNYNDYPVRIDGENIDINSRSYYIDEGGRL